MGRVAKRGFDVAVALVVLTLGAPFLVLIALGVAIDSGRPVIFRQERVGQGGQRFTMFKFRTMVVNSEAHGFQTLPGDQRVTRFGKLLRATSIDELPQLVNVLTGDMSLVGPRPDVASQIDDYTPADFDKRVSVRPGITGLAQAELRSQATPAERLALDLEYVEQCSLRLDLRVISLTIARIVKGG